MPFGRSNSVSAKARVFSVVAITFVVMGCGGSDDAEPAKAAAPACDPDARLIGGITTPSALVSAGVTVTASAGVTNADRAVDRQYHANDGVIFGMPTADAPEWLALSLEEGPTSLLLSWADAGYTAYDEPAQSPLSYTIETSADSTDGEGGEWTEVVAISDNTVRTRAHRFDFSGQSWVRFTVTQGGTLPVEIDEIELYDVSAAGDGRPEDSWFFLGDSITAGAFQKSYGMRGNFEGRINAALPDFTPIVLGGGIGGELARDGLERLSDVLAWNPDITYFGVGYGTNDSWGNWKLEQTDFEEDLTAIVDQLLADGRVPVLARIPYSSVDHDTLPQFNAVIDRLTKEHGLPCGPDLYAYFEENQDELTSDGVHPTSFGYGNMNGEWADAALALYPAAD
jgi:lysophospholipase L1-like esterase